MKNRKRNIFLVAGCALVLLLIGAFLDLPISLALFRPYSGFGRFFAVFGELPLFFVACLSSAMFLVNRNRFVGWQNLLSLAGFGLLMLLAAYLGVSLALGRLGGVSLLPWGLMAVVALCGLSLLLARAFGVSPEARRAAAIGFLLVLMALFGINLLKLLWGRLRFREMSDPALQFTAWYVLKPFARSDATMSFPSGHSANAATILWITLLPTFFPKARGKEWLLWGVAIAWTGMVMLSRIIVGAHFLSDVTAGAAYTTLLFLGLSGAFLRPGKEAL